MGSEVNFSLYVIFTNEAWVSLCDAIIRFAYLSPEHITLATFDPHSEHIAPHTDFDQSSQIKQQIQKPFQARFNSVPKINT